MANEQLNSDLISIDVTAIHTYVNQAIEGGKTFNRLFGYQLLIFYFQWFMFIMMNHICIKAFIHPEKYGYIHHINILEKLILLAFESILIAFNPCAVVFVCDMVAAEADKFMAACYEIEEKFHYSSHEYHELQTLICILANGVLQFTAAKFIEIKRSMMLSLIVSATTYFIALEQYF
ncbi:hypothetical protein ABEB36_013559 [Hypothenemus hampei]|uniref:Uncharacterized protein n=1 Tax=Hypothenemus hampei TaxID=57062 RepID=A0ABD1E937_HYPHA